MALNFDDQIRITGGQVFTQIKDYAHVGAVQFANDFIETYKDFPTVDVDGITQINQHAYSYVTKMLSFCNQVLNIEANNRRFLIDSIVRMIVTIGARKVTTVTIGQVSQYDGAQWQSFISNVIDTVFERLSGVTKIERQAYISI